MPPKTLHINVLRQFIPRASAQGGRSIRPQIAISTPWASQHYQPNPVHPQLLNRAFHISRCLQKKKTRADREAEEASASNSKTKGSPGEVEDPFDFSSLNSALEKNVDRLKNDLSKLRTGGRFNPEVLEDLRVVLSKEGKQTERLGDLAQVLVKGRTISVLVGDKDHVKSITSAVQGSAALNLQPVPDPHNQLALNIPVPPPTKESRDAALAAASKAGESANMGIKNARAAYHKKLRAMELKKTVRPDDMRKAGKEMEKIVEKAGGEVKKAVDAAKKSMEQQ